jgi:hypothetical protein
MPVNLPDRPRRKGAFPWIAGTALLLMGVVPIVALFSIGAVLDRGCTTGARAEGEAGPSLVWRIEQQKCGSGPEVSNVLLAPRGKSFALVASSTGVPRPVGIDRTAQGTTMLVLEAVAGQDAKAVMLPLKATGRPAQLLVLANGQPKR